MAGSDRPRAPPRPAERPKTNGCAVLEPPQRPPPALSAEKDGPGAAPLLVVRVGSPKPIPWPQTDFFHGGPDSGVNIVTYFYVEKIDQGMAILSPTVGAIVKMRDAPIGQDAAPHHRKGVSLHASNGLSGRGWRG